MPSKFAVVLGFIAIAGVLPDIAYGINDLFFLGVRLVPVYRRQLRLAISGTRNEHLLIAGFEN